MCRLWNLFLHQLLLNLTVCLSQDLHFQRQQNQTNQVAQSCVGYDISNRHSKRLLTLVGGWIVVH